MCVSRLIKKTFQNDQFPWQSHPIMIPIAPDGILICIKNLLLGRNSVDKTSTGYQNPPKSNMCINKKEDAFSSSDIDFD